MQDEGKTKEELIKPVEMSHFQAGDGSQVLF